MFLPLQYYAITGLVNLITSIFLGVFILTKSAHIKTNRIYAYFCFSIAFWSLFYYLSFSIKEQYFSEYCFRTCMAGVVLMPALFIHFTLSFLKKERSKKFIFLEYLLAIGFMLSIYTPWYATSATPFLVFKSWANPGFLFHFFLVYFFLTFLYSFYLLGKNFSKATGTYKNQAAYVFFGILIGLLSGSTNYFVWYRIPIPPIFNIFVSVYMILIAYGIAKYNLLDIRVAFSRAGIFILVYSLVLGFPLWLGYKYQLWQYATWAMLVLATGGPSIYIYFQKKAEERILREEGRIQEFLTQASYRINRIKELPKLLEMIIDLVFKTLKVSNVSIYMSDSLSRQYILKAVKYGNGIPGNVSGDSFLIQALEKNQIFLIYEELKLSSEGNHQKIPLEGTLSEIEALCASVIVPILAGNTLLGFLALGERKDPAIFSQAVLDALTILANSSALAIENLRSVEEMKKTQEKLFQAEKLAYIGQLASSVVHEVRNPITAIKTFVEYLPDKFRAQDKNFLERFEAIVPREVRRIEKMVRELLDLAKPRRINKNEIKVSTAVNMTLNLLKDNLQLKRIQLENECLTDDDQILGDEEQIQQVMLNLILNALDAMEEGGHLNVKVWREDHAIPGSDLVMVSVKDTGSGIPQEQLKTLFTPFQTTKKNGIGLGLIVTQEIVKMHGGKIEVESELDRGTRFTVILPGK